MLGMAPVTFVLSQYFGMVSPETPLFLGLMGLALFGFNRIRLPSWATTRQHQMDGVADRLTAALGAADPSAVDTDG